MTGRSQHPLWLLGWLRGERNSPRGSYPAVETRPWRGPSERDWLPPPYLPGTPVEVVCSGIDGRGRLLLLGRFCVSYNITYKSERKLLNQPWHTCDCVCVHRGTRFLLANRSPGIYGERGGISFPPLFLPKIAFIWHPVLIFQVAKLWNYSACLSLREISVSSFTLPPLRAPPPYYSVIHRATVG